MSRNPLPLHHLMVGVRAALRCYEFPPAAPEFEALLARLAASEAALEHAGRGGGVAEPRLAVDELGPCPGRRRPRAKYRAIDARWPRARPRAARRRRAPDGVAIA